MCVCKSGEKVVDVCLKRGISEEKRNSNGKKHFNFNFNFNFTVHSFLQSPAISLHFDTVYLCVWHLQSRDMPTARHFLNRQYWQRLRFSRIMRHLPSRRHRYSICFWMDRRKKPCGGGGKWSVNKGEKKKVTGWRWCSEYCWTQCRKWVNQLADLHHSSLSNVCLNYILTWFAHFSCLPWLAVLLFSLSSHKLFFS